MDIFDVISKICKCQKISSILKLCKFASLEDFNNFNDSTVDKIEKYVQIKCSLMPVNQREIYLYGSDVQHPDDFLISPGLRNRLLKAVDLLQSCNGVNSVNSSNSKLGYFQNSQIQSLSQSIHHSTNSLSLIPSMNKSIPINIIEVPKKISEFPGEIDNLGKTDVPIFPEIVAKKTYQNKNTEFVTSKSSNIQKVGDIEIDTDTYYEEAANIINETFNLNLVPKVDFDFEFHFKNSSVDSYAFYICHQCNNKKLKFKFNSTMTILYGNIKSHLKVHDRPDYGQISNITPTGNRKRTLSHRNSL